MALAQMTTCPQTSSWVQIVAQTWASVWCLVATWSTDINTDPGYDRITDPDMVLGSSQGPGVTMVAGGGAGH